MVFTSMIAFFYDIQLHILLFIELALIRLPESDSKMRMANMFKLKLFFVIIKHDTGLTYVMLGCGNQEFEYIYIYKFLLY